MYFENIPCEVKENICEVNLKLSDEHLKHNLSCDLFIDEYNLLFCSGNTTKRFSSPQKLDIKDTKNLEVNYSGSLQQFSLRLRCLPLEELRKSPELVKETKAQNCNPNDLCYSKLYRITDKCILRIDGKDSCFDNTFRYGFNGKYDDDTSLVKPELQPICRVKNPSKHSPISRSLKRENDEIKEFCRDQYKLNFVDLQVPDGLDNPMKYSFCFEEVVNQTEESSLKNILEKPFNQISDADRYKIDNELISILLAICYDVRTTSNEPNCESAWTRTILSSTLSYFEPIENMEMAIEIFIKRSLIYPLYRNYDLGRMCVEDLIEALIKGPNWIIKQLLITFNLFLESDDSRKLLNKYFIEDYIIYISKFVSKESLKFLAKNLKNSLLRITKKSLRLDLNEIETELLKELISDIHLADSNDSDDDVDDCVDDCENQPKNEDKTETGLK